MREFNVTGLCVAHKHYMVDISGKLAQIVAMIDKGDYFTINRARQYGKTTTLSGIRRTLPKDDYHVASISFEALGDESFASDAVFCQEFLKLISDSLELVDAPEEYREAWLDGNITTFAELGKHITKMCEPGGICGGKKVLLLIDEVDKTSNNRIFLQLLATLRSKFLSYQDGGPATFHSVILAGVYDIKNIKLKMINEGSYTPTATEGKIYNSPWNIAVDFEVDMSFNPAEIASMLTQYEADHSTGMDIPAIANEIYDCTSGYPFLVSRICQRIDKKLGRDWTSGGVQKAVQIMLFESNTLFDDLKKNIENNKELHDFLYELLILGAEYIFNADNPVIGLALMYGFIKKNGRGKVKVANKIFELRICNYFTSVMATSGKWKGGVPQRDIVKDGRFDMELCLCKFAEHYAEIYSGRDAEFLERQGRLLFLTYLKPLINGDGFYHLESELTDLRRMDLVVDYGKDQFVLELKIWRGEQYEKDAFEQLCGYLDSKGFDVGYLLTFDFRKGSGKAAKAEWVEIGGKRIFEVII